MSAPRNEREAYAELLRAWRIRRQQTVVIVLLAVIFTA